MDITRNWSVRRVECHSVDKAAVFFTHFLGNWCWISATLVYIVQQLTNIFGNRFWTHCNFWKKKQNKINLMKIKNRSVFLSIQNSLPTVLPFKRKNNNKEANTHQWRRTGNDLVIASMHTHTHTQANTFGIERLTHIHNHSESVPLKHTLNA